MKKIKVTKQWAAGRRPCPRAKQEFFKRYPNGLTLSRRNLYMVAEKHPISWLWWFAVRLMMETPDLKMRPPGAASYTALLHLAVAGRSKGFVRSQEKRRAFAQALADKLDLP